MVCGRFALHLLLSLSLLVLEFSTSHGFQNAAQHANDNGRPTILWFSSSNEDNENEETSSLGSLDTMLNRARKRKGIAPWYRFQAFGDSPIFKVQPYPGLETALVCTRATHVLLLLL